MARTAYKFRLNPNKLQEQALLGQLETLRQVYNAALGYWRDKYDAERKSPTFTELYRVFSALRNLQIEDQKAGGAGPHWLSKISAVSIRDTIKRLRKAFDRFFAIRKGKIIIPKPRKPRKDGKPNGYPRFKGHGRLRSIPFDNYGNGCALRGDDGKTLGGDVPQSRRDYRLDVFGVGRVKVNAHRDIAGLIKTVCVEREADGKWYAIVAAQTADVKPEPSTSTAVGIDLGLEHFLTTSQGEHSPNPRYLKKELPKLRRLQRAASRKMERAKKAKARFRDCRNLQKSFEKVAKLHVRIRNLRKEHHHREANRLVHKFGSVCVEKLNVRGMMRNGKLARAIQDAGWSGFLNVLRLKAARAGVRFVEVDASGTSQTCPECGGEARKALGERTHKCPRCGYKAQRDHAAARVILERGTNLNPSGPGGAGHNVAGYGERAQRSPQSATPELRAHRPKPSAKRVRKANRSRMSPQPGLWDDLA